MRDVIASMATDAEFYAQNYHFIEPRGLVNTGNMCYMNSVLQTLVFCSPVYDFLERVGRRAVHGFKSDFPLMDAMIMFLREFRVMESGRTINSLRKKLSPGAFEQVGDSFTPEYVYKVIRRLPLFKTMTHGHQQDAQEFMGFLLEQLHEECNLAQKQAAQTNVNGDATTNNADKDAVATSTSTETDDGWMEVGHKQKPTITRSSGNTSAQTPITKIFGGNLRSEFRVPGNQTSVTLEPYQSLQLDIGGPMINNVVDALCNLTTPEIMHGDFNPSRGPKVNATKQVFIESLPSVLVLHLKRFQFDSTSHGTQKIWKKIGYPLELELPREVFAPHRRNVITSASTRYRLTGVIFHHGKNASGGHYTVEVRRQDGREWIRLDDTIITRLSSEEIAMEGSEDGKNPSPTGSNATDGPGTSTPRSSTTSASGPEGSRSENPFDSVGDYDSIDGDNIMMNGVEEHGWSQVNGSSSHKKGHATASSVATASSAVNGETGAANSTNIASSFTTGSRILPPGKLPTTSTTDLNKVAYVLFYEKMRPQI